MAHTAENTLAYVAAATMTAAWSRADSIDHLGAIAANTALLTLIASTVGSKADCAITPTSHVRAELRAAVTRHVAAHVMYGTVSVAETAKRFGVSVRKLHQLFEDSDCTFSQMVMRARVDACTADLSSSQAGSLTDVAARWGFADLSHLNRVFRAQRGCLPSQYRREQQLVRST